LAASKNQNQNVVYIKKSELSAAQWRIQNPGEEACSHFMRLSVQPLTF